MEGAVRESKVFYMKLHCNSSGGLRYLRIADSNELNDYYESKLSPVKDGQLFSVVWTQCLDWISQRTRSVFEIFIECNQTGQTCLKQECNKINEEIPKNWGWIRVSIERERELKSLCLKAVFNQKIKEIPVECEKKKPERQPELIFVDFEFIGNPSKGNARAIEIGAYYAKNKSSFKSYIDCGQKVTEVVTQLTGITTEKIKNAAIKYKEKHREEMTFMSVWKRFEKWAQKQIGKPEKKPRIVLIGHGIKSDIQLIDSEFKQANVKMPKLKVVDTFFITTEIWNGLNSKKTDKGFHTLSNLKQVLKIPKMNSHRALVDAQVTCLVLKKLIAGLSKQTIMSLMLTKQPSFEITKAILNHRRENKLDFFGKEITSTEDK